MAQEENQGGYTFSLTLLLPFALQSPAGASQWPNSPQTGRSGSPGLLSTQASCQGSGGWGKVWSGAGGANRRSSKTNFLERTLELIEVYSSENSLCYLSGTVITSPKEQDHIRPQSSGTIFFFSTHRKIDLTWLLL